MVNYGMVDTVVLNQIPSRDFSESKSINRWSHDQSTHICSIAFVSKRQKSDP